MGQDPSMPTPCLGPFAPAWRSGEQSIPFLTGRQPTYRRRIDRLAIDRRHQLGTNSGHGLAVVETSACAGHRLAPSPVWTWYVVRPPFIGRPRTTSAHVD